MNEYLQAKFDLTEILEFSYEPRIRQLTVRGLTPQGLIKTERAILTTGEIARLLRWHLKGLQI